VSAPLDIHAVVPTFNERENIAALVEAAFSMVPGLRILVVDDNSPDGTGDTVRALQRSFPALDLLSRTNERGFGSAYLAGFRRILESSGTGAVLMMDADLSHDPAHVPALLEKLEVCDAVIGSRYAQGGAVSGWEMWRRILSRGGNAYVRGITGMPFHDCTSGFMLIRTGVLRGLDLKGVRSGGYAFLMELKYRIWQSGAVIREVPIIFRNRDRGESKISGRIIREGFRAPWRVRFGRTAR
jgi:glycosyltransferase involved in cell wall biosynthesis